MRMNDLLSLSRLCRLAVLGLVLMNAGCYIGNGWALNRSGMRQYQRGHYAQARHRFARAIAHDPCNPDYRHNLAMAIQKQGDVVTCEKILRYNLTIDAMHQPSYHSLAQMMVTQGRTAEAQDLVEGWVATQPYVPESNIEMAWLQRETGNVAAAEQSLQNALRADPTHPIALAHLGQLYQQSGRPDQAAAYYQRSLASNWDQPEVQSRLATLIDPGSMTRSAMMQNSPSGPMLAGSPIMTGDSMIVSNPAIGDSMMAGTTPMMASMPMISDVPFGGDPQAVALEDLKSNPAPRTRRRRHERDSDAIMATYPLPTFDAPMSAWKPTESAIMAFQPGTIASDTIAIPQLANGSSNSFNGMTLAPPSDPAHLGAPEMTASVPVVDPH